jgi:hypothetical protein
MWTKQVERGGRFGNEKQVQSEVRLRFFDAAFQRN